MDKSSSTAHLVDNSSVIDDGSSLTKVAVVVVVDDPVVDEQQLTVVVAESDVSWKLPPGSNASSLDDGKGSGSVAGSDRPGTPVIDPWDIIDEEDTGPRWSELSVPWKIWRIVWIAFRLCLVLGFLYLFVCSLDILTDAFQLLGGRAAGALFTSSLLNNPVFGLMVGVLVTVLVQSSSTSTSIVVSMVGSGILQVQQAIPIIMGANIGTTITNTLVALTQSMDRDTFRRAFAGATVHDMFNWLTVLVLLPIEVLTGYLYYMTKAMTQGISEGSDAESPSFLKVITEPLTKKIIQVDKKVITAIAEGTDRQKFPMCKYYCTEVIAKYGINFTDGVNQTAVDIVNEQIFTYDVKVSNVSDNVSEWQQLTWNEVLDGNSTKCDYLFVGCGLPGAALSEAAVGGILLAGSLIVMITCLLLLVKVLNSLLEGPMRRVVRRYINADFPGCFAFLTGYVAMLFGAGITVLVQSSSVFTSTLTPLVGMGVVTVERVYPLTLGSNIGTTTTGILAALTADSNMIAYSLQIALCHLFFNVTGIVMWYPIPPLRRVPIKLAKGLGNTTAKYRWFAVFYVLAMFFAFPLTVMGLSIAGWYVLLAVAAPFIILAVFVLVVNSLQKRRPKWLPPVLRSWDFLPLPLHSLRPYDRVLTVCCRTKCAQKVCSCCNFESGASSSVSSSDAKSSAPSSAPPSVSSSRRTSMCETNKAFEGDGQSSLCEEVATSHL